MASPSTALTALTTGDSVAKNTIKLNKEFENILGSTEFDNFLKHAVVYTRAFIREQLIRTQDRAAKSWMDVPPAFLRQVNEIAKQEFFGTDRISMAQARDETESSLHDFSFAYCHMLLFNSRHSRAPAKERYHFEGMYTIVMDVVKVILQAHSLSQVIDYELKRLFRSHLFSTETKQDVVDPIQAQFIASLYQQQLRAQHHRQMDHAGGGSGGGGSSGTAGMMAWVAANSGGGGSGGGGMGQTDRSGWMGSSMAGTMGGFASAVSGTHQHQPRGRSAGSSSSAGTTSGGRGGKPVRMGGVGQWGPPIGHGHGHARLHSQATRHPADQLHPPMLQPRPGSSASNRSAGSSHPHGHGSPGAMNRSGGGASRPTSGLAGNARLPTPAFTYRMDDDMGGPQLAATASSRPGSATFRRKKISINAVRMLRSPLANETLPPVQRFLFVQSRPEAISSVVG
ncbi:hypothetical protein BC831DRAFT_160646 [Entophlyctis helioformis]|nr:hypothetical protein BC831DRAFT_160646 [Entophlyctis helioformis]